VIEEVVIAELAPVGRFPVRVVENKRGRALDIREYLDREEFTGFTRKGIRLKPGEVSELIATLCSDSCQASLEPSTGGSENE